MKSDLSAQQSTRGLIPIGLGLALVGASGVSVLVLGLSELYVGDYRSAVLEGVVGLAALGLFFGTYGRYLDRLEAHTASPEDRAAPEEPADTTATPAGAVTSPDAAAPTPVSTNVVIGIVGAANGLLIAGAGLIWTRGEALVLNVLAGLSLMLASLLVWWFGRPRDSRGSA